MILLDATVLAALTGRVGPLLGAVPQDDASGWTIYVLNDNCPDYTWGFNEAQTRRAFADLVRAHLDEMTRTDGEPPENRNRYNMAVAQEALCFLEHYPERAAELVRRVREGRIYVSPFLCNSLWGFQSAEGFLRTLYPARRLASEWGFPLEAAHHIEEPSLPWGVATLLAGSGFRWLLVPFLDYDSTFGNLKNPPLFCWEGPDGSRLGVILDAWLSRKANYTQGAAALKESGSLAKNWIPRYRGLGGDYPIRAILASGTHGDLSPKSGEQARRFADAVIRHNAEAEARGEPRLINATLPMFCRAADAAGDAWPRVRGCFGHSWDLWPISLARYAAEMREGERAFLAAEALLAAAGRGDPDLARETRADRVRAEWCWAMLSDHAWNGTDAANRKVNAELRKGWAAELNSRAAKLQDRGWAAAGLRPDGERVVVFNPLSIPRPGLVRVEWPGEAGSVSVGPRDLPLQIVEEDGRRCLCFVSPPVPGFGFSSFVVRPGPVPSGEGPLRADPGGLESPFYLLKIDPQAGGIVRLVHKPSGRELIHPGGVFGRTVIHDANDHALENLTCEVVAAGPVLARLKLAGTTAGTSSTLFITVYTDLDRVDLDFRLEKLPRSTRERLCHVFPLAGGKEALTVETPAAIVRPRPQPGGDLLPGADPRRLAVQGFVDDGRATLATLDAFCLRLDLEDISFEALGNDQNYKEVSRNQNGEASFRFRYALRGRADGEGLPAAVAFARDAANPLLARAGRIRGGIEPPVEIPAGRAVATCLKPADNENPGGLLLRLWETAGRPEPVLLRLPAGLRKALLCDLIERDRNPLPVTEGRLRLEIPPRGLRAVRLLP